MLSQFTENRFNAIGHDYLWDEMVFRTATNGMDADDVTEAFFRGVLKRANMLIRWKSGKDVSHELVSQQLIDEAPYRIAYGRGLFRDGDPDEMLGV